MQAVFGAPPYPETPWLVGAGSTQRGGLTLVNDSLSVIVSVH